MLKKMIACCLLSFALHSSFASDWQESLESFQRYSSLVNKLHEIGDDARALQLKSFINTEQSESKEVIFSLKKKLFDAECDEISDEFLKEKHKSYGVESISTSS